MGKEQILSEKTETDARNQAEIINKKAERHEKLIVSYMEDAGLGVDKTSMTHRAKSEQSLYDKIKNAILDEKHPATFDESIAAIKDAIGTRTELSDFNYKNHPDIVAMYKKDPKKAVMMAAERQSEEMCEKVKEIIRRQAADENTPIKATRITNYMGKDGIPYFSAKQVAELRDYAAERGIDLNVKDKLTKVRPSGYTALQMNFVTKEGFVYEWQLRGEKINKFAECEHVPYDIRENKDVTGGRKILKNLYAPIETAVKRLDEVQYENYNKYLTAHYEYLRMQELGFESTPPRLEDFGLNDPKLKAENLELLHDLAEKLKKNFRLDKDERYQDVGNYVYKLLRTESNAERCYLQATVSEKAEITLKSTYCGAGAIKYTRVELASGEETVHSEEVPLDNVANHSFADGGLTWQMLSLKDEAALSLLNFISTHQQDRIKVSLLGGKSYVYYLMDSEKKALGETYHFAIVMRDIARLEKEIQKANYTIGKFLAEEK